MVDPLYFKISRTMNHVGFEVFMLQFIINIAPDIGKETENFKMGFQWLEHSSVKVLVVLVQSYLDYFVLL